MPSTIFFSFAGTGMTAEEAEAVSQKYSFKDGVICIYVAGCQRFPVGGKRGWQGVVAPNLHVGAQNIRNAVEMQGDKLRLNLTRLKEIFGDSIVIGSKRSKVLIDRVVGFGFSRGAVSTFAMARSLHDLNVPVEIIALDPVPGETPELALLPGTVYSRNKDLSNLNNIKKAFIFLASCAKSKRFRHRSLLSKVLSAFYFDLFFSQMLPRFHPKTECIVRRYPKRFHADPILIDEDLSQVMLSAGVLASPNVYEEKDFLSAERLLAWHLPGSFMQKIHSSEGRTLRDIPYTDHIKRDQKKCAIHFLSSFNDNALTASALSERSLQACYSLSAMYDDASNLPDALKEWLRSSESEEKDRVSGFIIHVHGFLNIVYYRFAKTVTNPSSGVVDVVFRKKAVQKINDLMSVLANIQEGKKCLSKLAFDHYVLSFFRSLKQGDIRSQALFPHMMDEVKLYLRKNPLELATHIKKANIYQEKSHHYFIGNLMGSIAFGVLGGGLSALSVYALPLMVQLNTLAATIGVSAAIATIALAGLITCAVFARKNRVRSVLPDSLLKTTQSSKKAAVTPTA